MEIKNEDVYYKSSNQDFTVNTRSKLLLRSSLRCSNPNCRRLTAAYSESIGKVVCIGEAAHIRANSPGGPRYEPNYDASRIENGIWLCPTCHTLIDKPQVADDFSVDLLTKWKHDSETNNYPLLEDAKTDMYSYFEQLNFSKSSFDFSLASDWQMLIVLFGLFNDRNVNICIDYVDSGDNDYFMEFYAELFNWFMRHNKIRRVFNSINLRSPLSLKTKRMLDNKDVCVKLSEAITDDNLMNFVKYNKNYAILDIKKLSEYLFGDDNDKIDAFFEFWNG